MNSERIFASVNLRVPVVADLVEELVDDDEVVADGLLLELVEVVLEDGDDAVEEREQRHGVGVGLGERQEVQIVVLDVRVRDAQVGVLDDRPLLALALRLLHLGGERLDVGGEVSPRQSRDSKTLKLLSRMYSALHTAGLVMATSSAGCPKKPRGREAREGGRALALGSHSRRSKRSRERRTCAAVAARVTNAGDWGRSSQHARRSPPSGKSSRELRRDSSHSSPLAMS